MEAQRTKQGENKVKQNKCRLQSQRLYSGEKCRFETAWLLEYSGYSPRNRISTILRRDYTWVNSPIFSCLCVSNNCTLLVSEHIQMHRGHWFKTKQTCDILHSLCTIFQNIARNPLKLQTIIFECTSNINIPVHGWPKKLCRLWEIYIKHNNKLLYDQALPVSSSPEMQITTSRGHQVPSWSPDWSPVCIWRWKHSSTGVTLMSVIFTHVEKTLLFMWWLWAKMMLLSEALNKNSLTETHTDGTEWL